VNLLSGGGEGKSGFASGAGGAANRRSQALAASRRLSMPVVGLHTATVTTHTGEFFLLGRCVGGLLMLVQVRRWRREG